MNGRSIAAATAAATFVCLFVACGTAPVEPTTVVPATVGPAPSAIAPPTDSNGRQQTAAGRNVPSTPAPAASPEPDPSNAKAALWQDEAVIDALTKNCNWDPKGCFLAASKVDFIRETGQYGDLSKECHEYIPLACVAIPSQSCNPNPCAQEDGCYASCRSSCHDCGKTCAKSCTACKSTCKDDTCRRACGKQCATCRGACVTAIDRCTSSGCAAESKRCQVAQKKEYAESTCEAVCPSVEACVAKCPGAAEASSQMQWTWYEKPCPRGCFERLGTGCPRLWEANCVGNSSRTIFMLSDEDLAAIPDE